ncbi:MAG: Zn-ribbon domain-containing OB-fold protein [Candidatus Hydrothermarchaeaceae archaeon]
MSIPRFWRNLPSRYNLIGTRCVKCSSIYFPPRNFCPKCRRQSKLGNVKLRGKGEVVTYTVIHTAPGGFERQAPYIMAVIKSEEGPSFTSQIVNCAPEDMRIGMKVEGVFRKIQEDGDAGLIHYGFKFQPVKD